MAPVVAALIPGVVEALRGLLKKKAPDVAQKVEELLSDPQTRVELEKLAIRKMELQMEPEKWELADRASAREMARYDMTSDSFLSKNVRPMVLIYLTVMFTIAFFLSARNEFAAQMVNTFQSLLLWVYGFYFGGRSLEKIVKIVRSK